MRFTYKVFKGEEASQIVIDARLPGFNRNNSGMTNCAKLFDHKNAICVEVSRHGQPVFLFRYGYVKGLIQYIIVDNKYRRKNLSRRFVNHIIKNYLPKQEILYTTFAPMATGRRIRFTDAEDLYDLLFEDWTSEEVFDKYEVVKKRVTTFRLIRIAEPSTLTPVATNQPDTHHESNQDFLHNRSLSRRYSGGLR